MLGFCWSTFRQAMLLQLDTKINVFTGNTRVLGFNSTHYSRNTTSNWHGGACH